LRIGDRAREVNIPLNKPVHMGRLDPASNIFPEVDLTNDGGVEKGVSRRHARILKRGAKIYIEDLGSSNGTFVNGQKLSPYFPEALTNGDSLRLGGLEIEVALPN
jgi:pSer/pThr/pTyr-binding forkhead associated (FHA) protein